MAETVTETKTSDKKDLQEEWSELQSEYQIVLDMTAGCGEKGQYYVNAAYAKLVEFTKRAPEYEKELPRKVKMYGDGDGMGGFTGASTATALHCHMRRDFS